MGTNEEMARYFDRLAPDWTDGAGDRAVRERILELMRLPEGCVIADIGCGKGVMFEHLLQTRPRAVIGVDVSGEMLRRARELHPDARIRLIEGDVLTAPLTALDAVVIYNAYPHLLDKRALAEKLARHVRPGGTVTIAHSTGRARINGRHRGGGVAALSVPLRAAEAEAAEFAPRFVPETMIDEEDLYFLQLRRAE